MKRAPSLDANAAAPRVCRLLRTKTAFSASGADDWQRGESTTAVYWCLATMEACGPDDDHCHPHVCAPRRACFQPPNDD